jgi:phosphate transport system permease protein
MPMTAFDSVRTMSVHFYILAREGISNENAYATAAVLIMTVLLVNLVAYTLMHRFIARRSK